MRHLFALLIFLFGMASTVDKSNAETMRERLEIANKIIHSGKQIYKSERPRRSYWVFEDEIYTCRTGLSSIPDKDGTLRPSVECFAQIPFAKIYHSPEDFETFKRLSENAMAVLYKANRGAEPFSQMEHKGHSYTFHMAYRKIWICSDGGFLISTVLCRENTDQTGFEDLMLD